MFEYLCLKHERNIPNIHNNKLHLKRLEKSITVISKKNYCLKLTSKALNCPSTKTHKRYEFVNAISEKNNQKFISR